MKASSTRTGWLPLQWAESLLTAGGRRSGTGSHSTSDVKLPCRVGSILPVSEVLQMQLGDCAHDMFHVCAPPVPCFLGCDPAAAAATASRASAAAASTSAAEVASTRHGGARMLKPGKAEAAAAPSSRAPASSSGGPWNAALA